MDGFIKRWQFTRSETIEILNALTDEQLQFKPEGDGWQTIYHQFGCIGRTQLVYAKAAEKGLMDFSLFGSSEIPSKDINQTVNSILLFLEDANSVWLDAVINSVDGVIWPDGKKAIELHISNLAEHERLHHGQLVTYFTLAGFELPAGFKNNWAL
jgi:hypothetical protein